jgi:hypothetical protein
MLWNVIIALEEIESVCLHLEIVRSCACAKLVRASTAMVATMVLFSLNTHADHAHCESSALRGVRAAFMNMAYRFMRIFGLLAKQCSR